MAVLVENISALATQLGKDINSILANIGSLEELTTTEKDSLVAAINELNTAIEDIEAGGIIDDSGSSSSTVWSAEKITSAIEEAINNLVNGAPEALDTLKELADAIEENGDAISALETIAAGHVKFDATQSLTDAQKEQARTNIDAVSSTELSEAVSEATSSISSSGNAATATKLATARTIALSGDATASGTFDGSSNLTLSTTLASSGVTAGSYGPTANTTLSFGGTFAIPQVTVDAKGRATSIVARTMTMPATPTTITGNAATATRLATARTISATGDVTWSVSFNGSSNVSGTATIASGVIEADNLADEILLGTV